MIKTIIARGFCYWLRAPRNDADVHRDEMILALARLLLGTCSLAAAARTESSGHVSFYEALSISYLVYSLLIFMRLRARPDVSPLLRIEMHIVDILWAVNLIILIDWPAMAFGLFFFILAGTAFRWGFWEAQLTSLSFCLVLLAGCSLYHVNLFARWHYHRRIEVFSEILPILALSLFAGLLAEAKAVRMELQAIGRLIEGIRSQSELEQSLRLASSEGLQLFGATQILAAIDEKRTGLLSLIGISDPQKAVEYRELDPAMRPQYFFPAVATSWRMKVTRQFGEAQYRGQTLEAGKLKHNKTNCGMSDAFMAAHPFRALLAVSLTFEEELAVRVFVIDPRALFSGSAGLRFLEHALRNLVPIIHDIYFVSRAKTRARAAVGGHVARELHDGVIQSLSSINLQLAELRRQLGPVSGHKEDSIVRIQEIVQKELAELRELTQKLRSLEVDSSRFLDFLMGLAVKFQSEHGIAARFVTELDEVQLRPSVCAELARIVQEALANVRKHSHASEVLVRFYRRNADGVIQVIDNGRGFGFSGRFSHEELQASGKGPMVIMDRARAIGAKVSVESIEGKGSWVEITFPYQREPALDVPDAQA